MELLTNEIVENESDSSSNPSPQRLDTWNQPRSVEVLRAFVLKREVNLDIADDFELAA